MAAAVLLRSPRLRTDRSSALHSSRILLTFILDRNRICGIFLLVVKWDKNTYHFIIFLPFEQTESHCSLKYEMWNSSDISSKWPPLSPIHTDVHACHKFYTVVVTGRYDGICNKATILACFIGLLYFSMNLYRNARCYTTQELAGTYIIISIICRALFDVKSSHYSWYITCEMIFYLLPPGIQLISRENFIIYKKFNCSDGSIMKYDYR